MSENRKLTGKVGMVFGGSRGIGAVSYLAPIGASQRTGAVDPSGPSVIWRRIILTTPVTAIIGQTGS
jgi:hypothetical protein